MIVFVRYNLGPCTALELQDSSSVAELKAVIGAQHGVGAELLRVLFAGRELHDWSSLQGSDLPDQSTIHVVLPPPPSDSSFSELLLQEQPSGSREEEQDSLTRVNLSSSRLLPPSSSSSFSTVQSEKVEDVQAAAPKGGRGQSTFFVYCKSCKSVKPGKLRVRCHGCKESTLTLSRGPSCWDDVLLPARIHGTCQSLGCHSNEAEFYMKCASHPTSDDDLSVSLDLIMNNTRDVPCIACCNTMEVILVFQCSERHVICLDCFHGYCQSRLNERQFVHHPDIGYTLPCPGCSNSLIKEVHHFRVLGDDQYGRYQRYGAEECLLSIGGLMCPSAGCGAGLLPSDDSRKLQCDWSLGCGFVFCRDCREAYHQGACATLQAPPTGPQASQDFTVGEEASQRGRWNQNQDSLHLIQNSTRPCPVCSVRVERDGGCMHMHCPRCGSDWCWLCGAPWSRECMADHWFG